MAKAKRFYYRCISMCDLGYWGPDQRRERKTFGELVLHSVRVSPSKGYDARGRELPPNYVVTDRPLAKQYLVETVKKVSRPKYDPLTGRRMTGQRSYRKKVTTPKFEPLESDEIDGDVRRSAIDRKWRDELFTEVPSTVELPDRAATLDKMIAKGDDDEETVPVT